MSLIPVDPSQYPTEYEPIDVEVVRVEILKFEEAPKPDKNNNPYLYLETEVVEPEDWRGRRLTDNYVAIPQPITEDMDDRERRRARESGIKFAQICACFGISAGADGVNLEDAVGKQGDVQLTLDEYKGRKMNRIRTYLQPKSE